MKRSLVVGISRKGERREGFVVGRKKVDAEKGGVGGVSGLAANSVQHSHTHTLPQAGEQNSTLGWIQTEFSGPEWGP